MALFTLWQKEDKVWIELMPRGLRQAVCCSSPKIAQGIGEAALFGGTMARWPLRPPAWSEFRRVHNQVQLLARNTEFIARGRTRPRRRAVRAGFSPSLLGSTAVAEPAASRAQVGPGRGQRAVHHRHARHRHAAAAHLPTGLRVRQPATRRSPSVRGKPDQVVFEVLSPLRDRLGIAAAQPARHGARRRAMPQLAARCRAACSSACTTRWPSCPSSRWRRARPIARVGYFDTAGDRTSATTSRARRASATSTAGASRRRTRRRRCRSRCKPIAFWLDRTIPVKYRDAITSRHPGVERGLRAHRLQGRHARQGAA